MKEIVLQYIRDYAPMVMMAIMMFIDRFGFGKTFSTFRSDLTKAISIDNLKSTLNQLEEQRRAEMDELREIREELKKAREVIERVKGAKK